MSPARAWIAPYSAAVSACFDSCAFVPDRLRSRCSASASSKPARSMPTPYSAASSTVRSIGKPYVSWSRKARSPRDCGASAGRSSGRRPTTRSASVRSAQRGLELAGARVERPRELRLLAGDGGQDLVAPLDEVRIGLAHDLDDDRCGLGHERLAPAEQPAVADGPAEELAQDVAAALVRGQDVVGDEERDRARVVGDDLVAEALGLEGVRVVAEQLAHPGVDRREQVGVVVGRDLLEDAGQALEAHPGVDAGERQRHAAVRPLVELHEHEVPDLEPARAVLGVVGHAFRTLRELDPAVEVDLAARAARTGVGHPPEVVVVAVVDVAPAGHPLRRQADLVAPDRPGDLVVGVGRGRQPVTGDAQVPGQEVPGPVDGLALEVVAERPVAEHLEQGVVARRPPDLLEVVVLARHPQAALVVDGARVRAGLGAGQDVLELDHARVREQERRVAGRDEARAGHDGVPALGEEVDEPATDLGGGQRDDPRVGSLDGVRHRTQWYSTDRLRRLACQAAVMPAHQVLRSMWRRDRYARASPHEVGRKSPWPSSGNVSTAGGSTLA